MMDNRTIPIILIFCGIGNFAFASWNLYLDDYIFALANFVLGIALLILGLTRYREYLQDKPDRTWSSFNWI